MAEPFKKKTIAEIKELLNTIDDEKDVRLSTIVTDDRKGVQNALTSWEKTRKKICLLEAERETLLTYEKALWNKGILHVAGIDEVGRGPLAGPVVAASVVLPQDVKLLGINDSKKLSASKREQLFTQIQETALAVGIGIVDAQTIDKLNILQAAKLAMKKSAANLHLTPDHLLIDAITLDLPVAQTNIIKGDSLSLSIGAASIIAKVTRDRMMEEYDTQYPGYGFADNAGYGTAQHLKGLEEQGPCPIHRFSFSPVSKLVKK